MLSAVCTAVLVSALHYDQEPGHAMRNEYGKDVSLQLGAGRIEAKSGKQDFVLSFDPKEQATLGVENGQEQLRIGGPEGVQVLFGAAQSKPELAKSTRSLDDFLQPASHENPASLVDKGEDDESSDDEGAVYQGVDLSDRAADFDGDTDSGHDDDSSTETDSDNSANYNGVDVSDRAADFDFGHDDDSSRETEAHPDEHAVYNGVDVSDRVADFDSDEPHADSDRPDSKREGISKKMDDFAHLNQKDFQSKLESMSESEREQMVTHFDSIPDDDKAALRKKVEAMPESEQAKVWTAMSKKGHMADRFHHLKNSDKKAVEDELKSMPMKEREKFYESLPDSDRKKLSESDKENLLADSDFIRHERDSDDSDAPSRSSSRTHGSSRDSSNDDSRDSSEDSRDHSYDTSELRSSHANRLGANADSDQDSSEDEDDTDSQEPDADEDSEPESADRSSAESETHDPRAHYPIEAHMSRESDWESMWRSSPPSYDPPPTRRHPRGLRSLLDVASTAGAADGNSKIEGESESDTDADTDAVTEAETDDAEADTSDSDSPAQ